MAELYIGLMSGTSMDAVDAGLFEFAPKPKLLASFSLALPGELAETLRRLAAEHSPHPLQCLGELDFELGELFAATARGLLETAGIEPKAVTAIGSHGQTLFHCPGGERPFTLQIGDANRIAARTGITTVADFRRRDMALGGQGAPLVPAFHNACFRDDNENRAILNIGGIANLTLLPSDATAPISGFDTGPGNTLMDAWCRRHGDSDYDHNGEWAAQGEVNETLLGRLLDDPYFAQAAPKSTGPEHFNLEWLEKRLGGGDEATDVQATLAELTARSISDALQQAQPGCERLIVCGGGSANLHLMRLLRSHLLELTVETSADQGLAPQWVEAAAFAWLAQETLAGRPGNLPSVTGASHASVLGAIYPA